MIDRDKEHTEEHKDANKKVVTVGGEKKLLLMDDDDLGVDTDLQEMIEALVNEALSEMEDPLDSQAADVRRAKKHAGKDKEITRKKARAAAGKSTQDDLSYDDEYWAELEALR